MQKNLQLVSDFHKAFGHPIKETPAIPDLKRYTLRLDMLLEELVELEEAFQKATLSKLPML